jgi:hypothetical protein
MPWPDMMSGKASPRGGGNGGDGDGDGGNAGDGIVSVI